MKMYRKASPLRGSPSQRAAVGRARRSSINITTALKGGRATKRRRGSIRGAGAAQARQARYKYGKG